MSVAVMSWVLRSSEEKLGRRLVLLVLADHANEDGAGAWPSVQTIADEARLSRRQTQNCLHELERAGSIRSEGVGPKGTTSWQVVMDAAGSEKSAPVGGEDSAPPGGAIYDTGGVQSTTEGGARIAPEPSLKQPPVGPVQNLERAHEANRPASVNRRRVTDAEYELAAEVLAAFNEQAGTAYRSSDWIAKIVGRLREHPELPADAHRLVIQRALAEPWWAGDASPSVVYGNAALFERAVHAVRTQPGANAPPRRTLSGDRAVTIEELSRQAEEARERRIRNVRGPGARVGAEARLSLPAGDAAAGDGRDVRELDPRPRPRQG